MIELLVVIAIIGLLASVVLLALNSARAKSRDAKRLADIRQVATALELYYNDNNAYVTQATAAAIPAALAPNYVGSVPLSPTPIDGTCTAGQNTYTYTSATGATYTLTFCLGAVTGGFAAGVHTASPTGIQ